MAPQSGRERETLNAFRWLAIASLLVLGLVACGRAPIARQSGDQAASGAPLATTNPTLVAPTPAPTCSETPPSPPGGAAVAFDVEHNAVVLFGGDSAGSSLGETLLYSGGCWSHPQVTVAPIPRQSAALIYDPDLKLSLLVGGRRDDPKGQPTQTIPGDVWTWNGQVWTQLLGAPHFGDAIGTYDPVRHVIVVLGASPQGVGTWTWDGSTWRLLTAQGPGVRLNPTMCFDNNTGSALLFGGAGIGVPIFGDTWLWDGSAWREQQPVHAPPARFEAAMSCGQRPLLFGGFGSYQGLLLGDTWIWINGDWQRLSPTRAPATQSITPFAVFDGSHQLVFTGTAAAQIWTWTGSDWASQAQ